MWAGWLIAHFVTGIKSNIPPCCVFYYCFWIYLFKRYPKWFSSWAGKIEIGYFRCPLCRIRGKINEVVYDGRGEDYYYIKFFRR